VPVGCCTHNPQLAEPEAKRLLAANFSQITPEYEMKMGPILADDGAYRFEAADSLVAFARENAMRVHGTALIWYKHLPAFFDRLRHDRSKFEASYREYIRVVVGRYRNDVVGWDVVNEPIAHLGGGLRDSVWGQTLGVEDHMAIAFEEAHAAAPEMIAFVNDYRLESIPEKRIEYMRLIERLLKRGTKISGIGTQSHLDTNLPVGWAREAIQDLASFGLPIHISELDVSFGSHRVSVYELSAKRASQQRIVAELCEAFMALPVKQRYAVTLWGLRDGDSWLRRPPFDPDLGAEPVLFDDRGRTKGMLKTMIGSLSNQTSRGGLSDASKGSGD
jgi:endo-1,4-beta-xylanase